MQKVSITHLEMPDYIDSFLEQAFQRKKVSGDTEKQKDIFMEIMPIYTV